MTDAEIVKSLAEKVMGWQKRPERSVTRPDDPSNLVWADETGYYKEHVSCWNPLANDAHACIVLDEMAADSWHFDLHNRLPPVDWTPQTPDCVPNGQWYACFSHHTGTIESIREGKHTDPDRRRAIAIAALKAVGAWQETMEERE